MKSVVDRNYLPVLNQLNNKVFLKVGPWTWGGVIELTDAVSEQVDFPVNRELDDYVTFSPKQQSAQRWI